GRAPRPRPHYVPRWATSRRIASVNTGGAGKQTTTKNGPARRAAKETRWTRQQADPQERPAAQVEEVARVDQDARLRLQRGGPGLVGAGGRYAHDRRPAGLG